ncbi:MAG: dUTP diphosphatase [Microscillaceae bacterium]|nr:dUTP diphosphatase [Microscillaceae bacterium]
MQVKIVNHSPNPLPSYATTGSAGVDLSANLSEPIILKKFERILIPTGIYIQLPEGYEAQIRPRSGLALKYGISVLNAPGTIDSDYIGEIKVLLINFSSEDFVINPGDRIAQMIMAKYEQVDWVEVETLDLSQRGIGGFGSTGIKH